MFLLLDLNLVVTKVQHYKSANCVANNIKLGIKN